MSLEIRLGTRRSDLALAQTRLVEAAIHGRDPSIATKIVEVSTAADTRLAEAPLAAIGGKGVFTKELEIALGEEMSCDACVHSLKDVPTVDPPGLLLAAVLPREDPRDILVPRDTLAHSICSLHDLPLGAKIGTSSLRRKAQLLRLRPDLQIHEVRGNVATRLKKLDSGQFEALVLAAAGIVRLGIGRPYVFLESGVMMHAVGQGAIAVQVRSSGESERARNLWAALNDAETWMCVVAERTLLREIEGGCRVPLGVSSSLRMQDGTTRVMLQARVVSEDGQHSIEAEAEGEDPKAVGVSVARDLRERGALQYISNEHRQ